MAINNILQFLEQVAEERGVDINTVKKIFTETIETIARKSIGKDSLISVIVNDSDGSVSISILKKVVKRVKMPLTEISLKEAKKYDSSTSIENDVHIPIDLSMFGRNFILSVKHLLYQKIREAEKEATYESYKKRVGDIITGNVRRIEDKRVMITFDRVEGTLPKREQIPGEYFHQGGLVKAYIFAVDPRDGILLSHTHPGFLKGLFEEEVPEIKEGIIEIKNVVRIAGVRAKISVASNDARIDPVGACVGVKGSRVQVVVKELGGEKIDVIQWSQDPFVYISRALSGVKALKEDLDEDTKRVQVIVSDEDLPVAIGKNGQNVSLCSKLTGYKIDIVPESMYNDLLVENLETVSPSRRKKFIEAGLVSAYDIVFYGMPRLHSVKGIGRVIAKKIYESAYEIIANKRAEEKKEKGKSAEET